MERYKRIFNDTKLKENSNFAVVLEYDKKSNKFYITTLSGNTYYQQDYEGMVQTLRTLQAKSKANKYIDTADGLLSTVMDPSYNGTLAILVDPILFKKYAIL